MDYIIVILMEFLSNINLLPCLNLSIGLHRKFAHNQFDTPKWF